MTRGFFLVKWAMATGMFALGIYGGPVSGTIAVIGVGLLAWADRRYVMEQFTIAGQFINFYQREQITSAFDSEENFVHVEFDPARDDLREITEDAREEGFEEFDRATMADGTQVLIFRRTVSS